MDRGNGIRSLETALLAGRIGRRDFVRRAVTLGLSASAARAAASGVPPVARAETAECTLAISAGSSAAGTGLLATYAATILPAKPMASKLYSIASSTTSLIPTQAVDQTLLHR